MIPSTGIAVEEFGDTTGDFTSQIFDKLRTPITTGSFGDVHRCTIESCEGETEVAVKVFKIDPRRTMEKIEKAMLRELEVWLRLKHSTIVPLLGTARVVGSPLLALVSQWMPSGTLSEYLGEQAAIITPSARIGLAKGIAEGLNYLHSENVVHGDLHPGNVLIDGSGNPFLIDFGLATVVDDPELQWTTTTTGRSFDSRWRAPEVIGIDGDPGKPTFKSDTHSFGSVMFFIVSGDVPWKEKKHSYQICIELSKRVTPARPHSIFDDHWELIQQCWSWEPGHRPGATTLLHWVQSMTEYPQGIADDSSHYKCLCDDTIPVPSSPNELVEMDMETIDPFSESLSIPDFIPSASHSLSDLTDSSQEKRRVSLTLPSSPRLVQAWNFRDYTGLTSHVTETSAPMPERKGKMRKIADDGDRHETTSSFIIPHKKPCKKWSEEETRMLVEGCNTWGFGNWKAILKDPKLKFGNCSPVDLKDRLRTCFPDAYKEHYPNTKIRLSSKVRSTLPDGRSIFENTRNKKPHIFPGEEARALKADYEKHVVSDVDMEDRDAEDDNVTFFPALSFVEGGSNDLKEYGLELQGREYELELQGQEYELELQGRVLDMQGDDEGLVAVPRALHDMDEAFANSPTAMCNGGPIMATFTGPSHRQESAVDNMPLPRSAATTPGIGLHRHQRSMIPTLIRSHSASSNPSRSYHPYSRTSRSATSSRYSNTPLPYNVHP